MALGSPDLVVLDGETTDAPTVVEPRMTYGGPYYGFGEGPLGGPAGQVRFVTYFKGNHFQKLDLKRGASLPTAQQVGSIAISAICGSDVFAATDPNRARAFFDLKDPTHSGVVFRFPGNDGACGTPDDVFRAFTLDMDASNPGIVIPRYLVPINNGDGSIAGHLVQDGALVRRLDANFTNPVTLFPVNMLPVQVPDAGALQYGAVFVYQDGSDVKAYNLATGAGPVTLATLASDETFFTYRYPGETYLTVGNASSGRIIAVTDTLAARVVVFENERIFVLEATPANLVYQTLTITPTGARPRIRSIGKAVNATPITLSGCDRPTGAQPFVQTFGENVYCGPQGTVPNLTEAAVGVKVFGTDGVFHTTIPNAVLLTPGSRVGTTDPRPSLVVLATSLSTTSAGFAGATIQAFDGVSGALVASYGSFPTTGGLLQAPPLEYAGYPKVLQAYPGTDVTVSPELFVLRDSPPSITRRTFNYP